MLTIAIFIQYLSTLVDNGFIGPGIISPDGKIKVEITGEHIGPQLTLFDTANDSILYQSEFFSVNTNLDLHHWLLFHQMESILRSCVLMAMPKFGGFHDLK